MPIIVTALNETGNLVDPQQTFVFTKEPPYDSDLLVSIGYYPSQPPRLCYDDINHNSWTPETAVKAMKTSSHSFKARNIPSSGIRFNGDGGFRLSFQTIAVTVGAEDNRRVFDVDERPLTTYSRFFAAMLSAPWRESRSRSVCPPEDEPDIFSIFALFIYTGKMFSPREGDFEMYPDGSRRDREWVRLARAWILGDKLGATAFKDAVADAICDKIVMERKWPVTLHQIIYSQTTPAARGSRRLCVDIAVQKWDVKTFLRTMRDEAWSEFFEDVAVKLFRVQTDGKNMEVGFEKPGCKYHEHVAEGTACWRDTQFLWGGEASSTREILQGT